MNGGGMVAKKESKIDLPNYEVIISVKNETYYCRIPELNLFAKGNDLESSYRELMNKKEKFIEVVEEFEGKFDPISPSTARIRGGERVDGGLLWWNGIGLFLIKAGAMTLLFLIVLYVSSRGIQSTISTSLDMIEKKINNLSNQDLVKSTIRPGRKIEKELYKAVDHPIDPERAKKITESLRVIVNRYRPFAKEFRPLLEDIGLAGKKK
jgi:hypothetical protein